MRRLLAALLFLCLLAGCGTAPVSPVEIAITSEDSGYDNLPTKTTGKFFAMDTYMTITIYSDAQSDAKAAINACADEVSRIEHLLSTTIDTSEISRLNTNGNEQLSDETLALLERALVINTDTKGTFDISIYPLMEAWGFTSDHQQVPSADTITRLLALVGANGIHINANNVTLDKGVQLDLGAMAKGYTSTRLTDILAQSGIRSAVVNLGGNVQVLGNRPDGTPFKVGIKNPSEANVSSYAGVLRVHDTAVITSGGYERYFEQDNVRYHHIIDPSTGYPAQGKLTSVTVVSPDGTLDDCLATALYIMDEEKAIAYWRAHADDFDLLLVDYAGHVQISEGLQDCFIPADLGDATVIPRKEAS